MTCLQEQENGNFIVGNCHAGPDNPQIFEITREKKIVWEFNEFELVGNGLAYWQVIEGKQSEMVLKKLKALREDERKAASLFVRLCLGLLGACREKPTNLWSS